MIFLTLTSLHWTNNMKALKAVERNQNTANGNTGSFALLTRVNGHTQNRRLAAAGRSKYAGVMAGRDWYCPGMPGILAYTNQLIQIYLTHTLNMLHNSCSMQGSHCSPEVKFKDFSRTFKDSQHQFSRTKQRHYFIYLQITWHISNRKIARDPVETTLKILPT